MTVVCVSFARAILSRRGREQRLSRVYRQPTNGLRKGCGVEREPPYYQNDRHPSGWRLNCLLKKKQVLMMGLGTSVRSKRAQLHEKKHCLKQQTCY